MPNFPPGTRGQQADAGLPPGFMEYVQGLIGQRPDAWWAPVLEDMLSKGLDPRLQQALMRGFTRGRETGGGWVKRGVKQALISPTPEIPETFAPDWLDPYMQSVYEGAQALAETGASPLYSAIMGDVLASYAPFEEYMRAPLAAQAAKGVLQSSMTERVLGDVGSELARQYAGQSGQTRRWLTGQTQSHLQGLLGQGMQAKYLPWTLYSSLSGG